MKQDDCQVSITDENRKAVYAACVDGAADLWKATVSIATAFLGGSLLYLEKFADVKKLTAQAYQYPVWMLFIGWLLLVVSILLTLRSQRLTLNQANEVISPTCNKSLVDKLFKAAKRCDAIAHWLLIAGMALLMAFGFINVFIGGK